MKKKIVSLAAAGQAITGSWNATVTVSGQTATARNLSYNGAIAPGASVEFGFQANRSNSDTSVPTGLTCTAW